MVNHIWGGNGGFTKLKPRAISLSSRGILCRPSVTPCQRARRLAHQNYTASFLNRYMFRFQVSASFFDIKTAIIAIESLNVAELVFKI